MVVVGEILLNAFFPVLFHRLASRDFLNFVRRLGGGVDSDFKKWEKKLKMIQAVLVDAEEKQLTDEAVKMWLDDLQDLAYDAEDILDEFATQALKNKLMADPDEATASTSKVQNLIPACFNCFNPSTIVFNSSMLSKVKEITSRLEELVKQRFELGLQSTPGGTSSTARQQRPPSSSVPTERLVFGRDQDKAKILEMVLNDTSNDANFVVIPIVGMGGIGKTTLAQEVYNDKAVENSKFDVKAWVCVSDVFDVLSISKALLESITRKPCNLSTLNEVQVELKRAVDGKTFLLVLDDVWNEDYSLWVYLKAPFLAAAPNSKMIVTTRHSRVASTMGPIDHYNLKHLSDDDCWSIFIKHTFEGRDLNTHQISESFRRKVVGKCGGLPLAAKTLGGLLRANRYDVWEDILDSKIWNLPQQCGILPVLRLSYHHLPSHLKRCFAYCAIFPKDYKFSEKELVYLWVAGDIIQQSRNNEQLENWANKCFHDLVSRSIFQQSDNSYEFVMHDLIHDLAQLVSGETIFRLEEANAISRRFERARYSSYVRDDFDGKNKFEGFCEIENIRTFLPVCIRGGTSTSYITSMVLSDLLPKFKKLRVLSLQGYKIYELSISFKDLRLLRYLNLTDTMIRNLPESTSSLLNLEILILRNCTRLIKLPSNMRNLINLHHLDIKGANLLKEMPFGMRNLKNLRTLSNFIVGKVEIVSSLEDLKILKCLHGELCVAGLENVNDSQKAREAALSEKNKIEVLSLEWNSNSEVVEHALEVLDMLQPHKSIKELTIKNYSSARFPLWIADPSFSKMEILKLDNCENCIYLPLLGLLSSLKHLSLKGLKKLKSIGYEVYGEDFSKAFQSLEILNFENLAEWEYWDTNIEGNEHVEIFPQLRELSIVKCPLLSGKLPKLLPSLKTLVVSECGKLVLSFSSFSILERLEVDQCERLVCRTPVDCKLIKHMTISSSSLNIEGRKGMLYDSRTDSSLFKTLTISNILEFGKLLKEGFWRLDTLAIGNSKRIDHWKAIRIYPLQGQGLITLADPGEVSIEENCISLVSLPEIKFFPYNLRTLIIEESTTLKSLPEEMVGNNSQLECLFIKDCHSLAFIARRKLPSSLKKLYVWNCKNLQQLVNGEEDASSSLPSSSVTLKRLDIRSCPELTTLSSRIQLFEALEDLAIRDCEKLESLPDGLQSLNCLQFINLDGCPSIVSLPNDIHKLNSLQYLRIDNCPSIVSFPEEGIPTNLTSLVIGDVKIYKALIRWGLQRLTSLRYLFITGCHEAELFPDEEMGMMLPPSLTNLTLRSMSKLKYLSSFGFQNLICLKYLSIKDCPNLKFFPEEGLPSSLLQLRIVRCPKLKQECKRDKGKEWSKIAHIPYVRIDGKFIYDPDSEE